MSLSHFITNEPEELIAKGSSKKVPWYGLILFVPLLGLLFDTKKNLKEFYSKNIIIAILITLFMICGSIYFWYMALDKRIKLIINRNGIAFKQNTFLSWENIWYYYIEEEIIKAKAYHFLYLKDKLLDKTYKIEITFYDKTYQEIQSAISNFSKDKSIIDLGFESIR
jgi:hypothetical protein